MKILIFRFNEAPTDNMFLELFELFKQAKRTNKVRIILDFLGHSDISADLFDQIQLQATRLREYGGGIYIVAKNNIMREKINYLEPLTSVVVFDSVDKAVDNFSRGLRYA